MVIFRETDQEEQYALATLTGEGGPDDVEGGVSEMTALPPSSNVSSMAATARRKSSDGSDTVAAESELDGLQSGRSSQAASARPNCTAAPPVAIAVETDV